MGRSVNKVTIIGCMGHDPQLTPLPSGNAVVNLSLATDESYNDKSTGQKIEQTEWHRVTAYGKLAEIIAQYLKKGAKIYIEGKLKTRTYEKDGITHYTTEIIANKMVMLDSKNQDNGFRTEAQNTEARQNTTGHAPQSPHNQPDTQPMAQPTRQTPRNNAYAQAQYTPQEQEQPTTNPPNGYINIL
jgi:single-strand DNA-binding protein